MNLEILERLIREEDNKRSDLRAGAEEALKRHYLLMGACRQCDDHLEVLRRLAKSLSDKKQWHEYPAANAEDCAAEIAASAK